jgi:hypothetical protein
VKKSSPTQVEEDQWKSYQKIMPIEIAVTTTRVAALYLP